MIKTGVTKNLLHPLIVLVLFLSSCEKHIDWNAVSLATDDKKPYGGYIAGKLVEKLFPHSKVMTLSKNFRYTSIDNRMDYPDDDSVSLLLLTGFEFQLNTKERNRIMRFAERGNEVLLFYSYAEPSLEEYLKLEKEEVLEEFNQPTWFGPPLSHNKKILSIAGDTTVKYGYEGRALSGSFTLKEGNKAEVLGYSKGRSNIVRFAVGDGHITLHAAPLVLSNYFLLQDGNKRYLEQLFSSLPDNISSVYWSNYYRRRAETAGMDTLLRNPAMRWSFFILLLCVLFYVLFNGKRRQRIIPVMEPPANSSVSFVETVGKLYYNKGNHANLAEKMVQQFLEWVRQHYFINTNELDENFIQQLSIKSGKPIEETEFLVRAFNSIRKNTVYIDEQYLLGLYKRIQAFSVKN